MIIPDLYYPFTVEYFSEDNGGSAYDPHNYSFVRFVFSEQAVLPPSGLFKSNQGGFVDTVVANQDFALTLAAPEKNLCRTLHSENCMIRLDTFPDLLHGFNNPSKTPKPQWINDALNFYHISTVQFNFGVGEVPVEVQWSCRNMMREGLLRWH